MSIKSNTKLPPLRSGARLIILIAASLCLSAMAEGAGAPVVEEMAAERAFTICTARLEAKFKAGRIVHLKNLLTGELVCDEKLAGESLLPGGMGSLSGNVSTMCVAHSPWGNHPLNSALTPTIFYPNQHFPDSQSSFKLTRTPAGAVATWTDLSDGTERYSSESLTITVEVDAKDGALRFTASGSSDRGGVFGIQVPLVNVVSNSSFFVPSFGGLEYSRTMSPAVLSFGVSPFIEVPALAFETAGGSVGLWSEDAQFNPFYAYLGWNGKSFAFAFEHQNLMPFEPHKTVTSGAWKLDVFAGGWVDALTPYKNWYAAQFAEELKIRDSVAWADKIRVVIDGYAPAIESVLDGYLPTQEVMQKIADTFDPSTVMLHSWNARAPDFDRELPDWTPRSGYADAVKLAHSYGLKTMAYVNTYCINYNSKVFIRDNLKDVFLTRKSSIYEYAQYKSTNAVSELLIGTINQPKGDDQFAGMKDGKVLYGDPLSTAWRKYHIEQMRVWNSTTGTDANYEDTAGCTGDFRNGVMDGVFAQQGSIRMMRELLAAQPQVPMASEYGPSPIAFGVRWPLNYAQVWGSMEFRRLRLHHQRPVSSYLFGFRQWIPRVRAESDFLMHLVTSCSDAAGGMAQFPGDLRSYEADRGMLGHMKWRAQLFSRLQLTPHFKREKYERDLVCLYRDKEGKIYKYYDDGAIQRMQSPDGKDLYLRVSGVNSVKTDLVLPGWPAAAGGKVFGLNPEAEYAFFPASKPEHPLAMRLNSLPDGVRLTRYVEEGEFAVMVLEATKGGPVQARIELGLNGAFPLLSVNGRVVEVSATNRVTLEVSLPASILYSQVGAKLRHGDKIGRAETTRSRFINQQGVAVGHAVSLGTFSRNGDEYLFTDLGNGEKAADFLVFVPDEKSALRLRVKNDSAKWGNASLAKIYVDGQVVHAYDSGSPNLEKQEHDQRRHEWIIPIGNRAGRTLLITIACDGKTDSVTGSSERRWDGTPPHNADRQWFSMPELIEEKAQEISDRIVDR